MYCAEQLLAWWKEELPDKSAKLDTTEFYDTKVWRKTAPAFNIPKRLVMIYNTT